ncbi:MAG: thiamine diphosphokinase [Ignavibacteriales bacterium]|nr:thiamine diphosphokinase [Ignavibacteriales bacterium]
MKKCIILANGQPPRKKYFDYLIKNDYQTLICADGGANSAEKLNIIPDYIIGDLDSINPGVYDYYYEKCEIIKITRQNDTDVEKCLKFAIKKKYDEVILLGATGDRLDHSFCNIGIVLKFFDKIIIKIIHHKSILTAFTGKVRLKTFPKETISIYGIDSKTKIYSHGLKYELKNISLPFGIKESTSNVALQNEVELDIRGGIVFVIRDFETMRKYGLF